MVLLSWVVWIPWPCRRCSGSIRQSCCRARPCRPFASERDGISIGEGAGFALLDPQDESPVRLLGAGESADAYQHVESPHPEGAGAATAMRKALSSAGLAGREIDYINLQRHGQPCANDSAEDRGWCRPSAKRQRWRARPKDGPDTCSARRASLRRRSAPSRSSINGYLVRSTASASIRRCTATFASISQTMRLRHVMSNSFGFGGSNCSLVFDSANEAAGDHRRRRSRRRLARSGCRRSLCWMERLHSKLGAADKFDLACLPPIERRARERELRVWRLSRRSSPSSSEYCRAGAAKSTVFSSADGDTEVLTHLLAKLATRDIMLSPTLFRNSVFNAPAGYWSLGCKGAGGVDDGVCAGSSVVRGGSVRSGLARYRATGEAVLYIALTTWRFPKP